MNVYLDFCSTTELPPNQQQELLPLNFCWEEGHGLV